MKAQLTGEGTQEFRNAASVGFKFNASPVAHPTSPQIKRGWNVDAGKPSRTEMLAIRIVKAQMNFAVNAMFPILALNGSISYYRY